MKLKWSYWLTGLSIFLLIISIALNFSSCTITDESIVIVFIGILVTFVVISNYAQLMDIRNEFNDKVDELDQKINYFNNYISTLLYFLLAKFEALLSQNKVIEAYDFFFDNYSKEFENATLNILWKYFGGMFIGFEKSEDEKKKHNEKYKENLIKAERLGVSTDFLEYMKKAFLSDGKSDIVVQG